MKVNFVVRRTKKKVDGCVPIEMTICVKGKRRYVSTGREVKPNDFSSKTQTVRGDKELNDYLKALIKLYLCHMIPHLFQLHRGSKKRAELERMLETSIAGPLGR